MTRGKAKVDRAAWAGDVVPIADKACMTFREGLLTINGVQFILQPERGVHNAADVEAAKRWLRNERDCIGFIVEWQT